MSIIHAWQSGCVVLGYAWGLGMGTRASTWGERVLTRGRDAQPSWGLFIDRAAVPIKWKQSSWATSCVAGVLLLLVLRSYFCQTITNIRHRSTGPLFLEKWRGPWIIVEKSLALVLTLNLHCYVLFLTCPISSSPAGACRLPTLHIAS